jgi:hypothetical protein
MCLHASIYVSACRYIGGDGSDVQFSSAHHYSQAQATRHRLRSAGMRRVCWRMLTSADVCYSAQYYFQALTTRSWLQSAGTYICVSAYLYIFVLIPLYVCPHNFICVSSYLYICPDATICVRIPLCICPHTSMYVSSYPYTLYKCRRFSLWCPTAMVNPSLLTNADVCWRMLTYADVCRRFSRWCPTAMVNQSPANNTKVRLKWCTGTKENWRRVHHPRSGMLTYPDVCWRMLSPSPANNTQVCWRMLTFLTYADVCWRMWASPSAANNMQVWGERHP